MSAFLKLAPAAQPSSVENTTSVSQTVNNEYVRPKLSLVNSGTFRNTISHALEQARPTAEDEKRINQEIYLARVEAAHREMLARSIDTEHFDRVRGVREVRLNKEILTLVEKGEHPENIIAFIEAKELSIESLCPEVKEIYLEWLEGRPFGLFRSNRAIK